MRESLNMSLLIASRSRLPIESAVFAAACLPVAADAEALNEEPSIKVNFGDLDLNMHAGRLDLLTRLKKGADRVCLEQALTLAGTPTTIRRAAAPPLRPAVIRVHQEYLSALFAATSRPPAR